MASAALVAAVIAPAAASALLTNEYGQKFAGTTVCTDCHGPAYDATSHGQFVRTGASMSPASDSAMWPVGLADKGETVTSDGVFALGAGTGLHEYIKFGAGTPANGPFGVLTAEWDPRSPSLWEIDGTVGVEFEDYACNQCHQLGAVKKGVRPPISGATTGTLNTWAIPDGANPAVLESYVPGSSIQCERCHGTGVAANASNGGHWSSGVKIVGFNTPEMKITAQTASTKILKSEVCGQCHASFKSGNIAGFTPDATITAFVPGQYSAADVPTVASFTANPGAFKFFPASVQGRTQAAGKLGGQNKGNKHVYYTEWAMSGHSMRGALTSSSPGATPYQRLGKGRNSVKPGGNALCNHCMSGEVYVKHKLADEGAPLGNIAANITDNGPTTGQYGVECATCHVSHGATTSANEAVGMAVRVPESANGKYSTVGLDVDNESICEDCHNWEVEIEHVGAGEPEPELPTTILGRYYTHPQREMIHGRGMVEIPAASDFMPGVRCEQCHMPATRSDFPEKTGLERYADRSWKRYSHRMFIMMPGDAKAWGLAPWGDSCSPCHAGETQDQLQANIGDWQNKAADLAQEVTSAINAAVARGDSTAAGENDLLLRASANYSNFVQDRSAGAHNPPYEQAGLSRAIELAKSAGAELTMVAPTKVSSDAMFAIAGAIEYGDETDVDDATVELYKDGTLVGTTETNEEGNYAFAYAQDVTSTYTVKWARSSASVSDLSMSATVTTVSEKTDTDTSIWISKRSVKRGASFRVAGHVVPAFAGAPVVIQYQKSGWSSWLTLSSSPRTTDATGYFNTSVRMSRLGTWTFRASFAGDSTHDGSSATRTVRVVR